MVMGWYSQVIFPRLCDLFLGTPIVSKLRHELLAEVHGEILEIGFGSGLNLANYPKHIRKITTVDPNAGMNRLAQKRIKKAGIEVEQLVSSCERIPFEDDSVDCVVSTFTLCSIDNVEKALSEVRRVLRPGGAFLFLEHGLSPDSNVCKWQRRLNWLEMRLGDGCRLDRNIRELVSGQRFASVKMDEFYMARVPRTHGYMYRGKGVK